MTKVNWNLDSAHSSINFSVRHMMISRIRGTFNDFSAQISADIEDLSAADIAFTIQVQSVNTHNADRDTHLRTGDFFDVETYPTMNFKSTKIDKQADHDYLITGDLTIRGVTKTAHFSVVYEGQGVDPWGNKKVGFTVSGKINRTDYGLSWNAALETGGVLVGDEVKIDLDIQAVQA